MTVTERFCSAVKAFNEKGSAFAAFAVSEYTSVTRNGEYVTVSIPARMYDEAKALRQECDAASTAYLDDCRARGII